MKLLVCGGRDYTDRLFLYSILDSYLFGDLFLTLIHGGAPGADRLAGEWARSRGCKVEIFPAHWSEQGRAAGVIRNQRMLAEGKPDLVLAFPGGRGTEDMMRRARRAGVPLVVVANKDEANGTSSNKIERETKGDNEGEAKAHGTEADAGGNGHQHRRHNGG